MCGLIVVITAVCLFVVVFSFLLQLFIDVVSLLANEFVVFDVDIALCSFTPCSFSFLLFLFVFVCLFVLLLLLLLFLGGQSKQTQLSSVSFFKSVVSLAFKSKMHSRIICQI